jgi:hypothetical protein
MNNPMKVYVEHFRACGFCLIPGTRDWFKQHGMNFRDFLKNGIDADKLPKNDAFADMVKAQAMKTQHGVNNGQ